MDGTLLDSSYAMTCSVNHVRKTLGLQPISKEFLEFHINEPNENMAMIFYETQVYNDAHKELFKEHYLANANLHVKPYESAYDFLEYFYEQGVVLSIATNAADFFAINMLEAQDMLKFFTHVIGANNVQHSKPDPDMVDLVVNKTKINKKHTLFVGDSIKDELAALNADVAFAFVNWGYGRSEKAKNKFDNINQLWRYIQNKNII